MPETNETIDFGNIEMWPPGTVRLESRIETATTSLILQPRPSTDPNDPLNWPKKSKYWNFGLVCFYAALVAEFINASSPTWGPMNKELGYSFEILNDSYAAGCAALAIGSVLLIPFALKFGRRPLYLFSLVFQFGISIWSAKMHSVADLMLVNILQCLFGSLAEVIVQMTIADVFFVHQRGRMNAIYVWVWLLASYLGSLIAGFVAQGQGWRWIWWWNVIVFGCSIFVFGFGYEETKFCPSTFQFVHDSATGDIDADVSRFNSHEDKINVDTKTPLASSSSNTKDKSSRRGNSDTDLAKSNDEETTPQVGPDAVTIDPGIQRKTYLQRLAIVTNTSSTDGSIPAFIHHMYQPFILLATVPAVTFAALTYGILVGLGDVMSTTLSTFMVQAPYNFSSVQSA